MTGNICYTRGLDRVVARFTSETSVL